jgi:hypothetical protein
VPSLAHTVLSLTHTVLSQAPVTGAVEAEAVEENEIEGELAETYVVDCKGRTCKVVERKREETRYPVQLSFHIVEVLSVVSFPEGEGVPIFTLLVSWRDADWPRDRTGDVVYWRLNEPQPDWSNARELRMELAVRPGSWANAQSMNVAFQTRSHLLQRVSRDFGVTEFAAILSTFPAQATVEGITVWGCQPNGIYVYSNGAVVDGRFVPLTEAGVFVHAMQFTQPAMSMNTNPLPVHHFPRIRVCPAPWIVLFIFRVFFWELIPSECGNNSFVAYWVVIDEIMKMFSQSRSAKMDGGLYTGGTTSTIVHAKQHSTRKTLSLSMVKKLIGQRNPHEIGLSSPTGIRSALSIYAGMLITVDDWESTRQPEEYRNQFRMSYDQNAQRTVQGDRRVAAGHVLLSTNHIDQVILSDAPAMSRLFILRTRPQGDDELRPIEGSADLLNVLSCFAPSCFAFGLYDGKLDAHSITDCATFFRMLARAHGLPGMNYERISINFGKLLFAAVWVLRFAGAKLQQRVSFFKELCMDLYPQHLIATQMRTSWDEFMHAIHLVFGKYNVCGPPEACLHFHNLRVGEHSIIFDLRSVCLSLAKHGHSYSFQELNTSLPEFAERRTAQMINSSVCWPLQTRDPNGITIPMTEEEALKHDEYWQLVDCISVPRRDWEARKAPAIGDVTWEAIYALEIETCLPHWLDGAQTYPFMQALLHGWHRMPFMERGFGQHPLWPYVNAHMPTNGNDQELVQWAIDAGWTPDSVAEELRPARIASVLTYSFEESRHYPELFSRCPWVGFVPPDVGESNHSQEQHSSQASSSLGSTLGSVGVASYSFDDAELDEAAEAVMNETIALQEGHDGSINSGDQAVASADSGPNSGDEAAEDEVRSNQKRNLTLS